MDVHLRQYLDRKMMQEYVLLHRHCAAASWNAHEGRIRYGFAFEDARRDESDVTWSPEHVNFYTDTDIWELDRIGGTWYATQNPHDSESPYGGFDLGRNKR